MPPETPFSLQDKIQGLPGAELQKFNTWLKGYQETLNKYQARAQQARITMPVGSFMPIDGTKIQSPSDPEGTIQPNHAGPKKEVDKRLTFIGQYEAGDKSLTFVGPDGRYWVGPRSETNSHALKAAGYQEGNVDFIMKADSKFADPALQRQWEAWEKQLNGESEILILPENRAKILRLFADLNELEKRRQTSFNFNPNELNNKQREISDALNLPADGNFRAVESLEEDRNDLLKRSTSDEIWNYVQTDPAFFEKIFAQADPRLREALAKYQSTLVAVAYKTADSGENHRLHYEAAGALRDLIDQAAGIQPIDLQERRTTEEKSWEANTTFNKLMREETAPLEDLVKAFAEKTKWQADFLQASNAIFSKRADFFEAQAKKAGVEIVMIDQPNNRVVWLEHNAVFLLDRDKVYDLFNDLRNATNELAGENRDLETTDKLRKQIEDIEGQIDDALELPEEVNSRTLQKEAEKRNALLTRTGGLINEHLPEHSHELLEVLERLSAHASPQLREAFIKYQKIWPKLSENDQALHDYWAAYYDLMDLVNKEAGLEPADTATSDISVFDNLLKVEPPVTTEALINFFVAKNRIRVTLAKAETANLERKVQFFEGLAEKAGIKVISSPFGLSYIESRPGLAEKKLGGKTKGQLDNLLGQLGEALVKEEGQTVESLEEQTLYLLDHYLPKDERRLTDKEEKQLSTPIFNAEKLLNDPTQVPLLNQVFDQAPTQLKEAFTSLRMALGESRVVMRLYLDQIKEDFIQKFEAACMDNELQASLEHALNNFEEASPSFWRSLDLPAIKQINSDDLVSAYITMVGAQRAFLASKKQIQERKNQFIAGLADKAGLKLVEEKKKTGFLTGKESTGNLVLAKK